MKLKIYAAFLGLLMAFAACQPEEFSLGEMISKGDLKYSITQDANDPNMVILESQTLGVTPLWITPAGRSTQIKDTVKIAFAGEYQFIYGVESAGGFVQADTFNLSITTNNFDYVNDPLWNYLTGGVGASKTWILDNGKYGLAPGPLSYADPSVEQVWGNYTPNWEPDGSTTGATDDDYAATMTFDLIGGPHITSVKPNEGNVTEEGTFGMNTTGHTLSTTDATIIRLANIAPNADNWTSELKILDLKENQLRIAVMRTNDEGPWWYIFNYVSKDYADNYQYAEPEPALPDGWQDDISKTVNTTITWKLSEKNPLDWANLDGSMMNGWQKPEDYPDWLGTPDPSVYGGFSMTMNSADQSVVFVTPDGTTTQGTYSVDEKGIYSFDIAVPTFTIINWASFAADANNQLRILKIEKDATGAVAGIWLGARDPSSPQYTAFHLTPQLGGGTVDPLAAWKNALIGKTFTPDVNWFVDWVNFPPDFTGGWTSSETFGDDYTSNGWVWDANVRAVAESTSLSFTQEGDNIKLTLSQTKDGAPYTATGDVVIDPENNILNINIPLVDYAGTAASWLPTTNTKSVTGDTNDFYFVSHGGNNLSNVDTEGFWLGVVSNSTAAGDDKDEVLIYHFVKQ